MNRIPIVVHPRTGAPARGGAAGIIPDLVTIGELGLAGDLAVPARASGIVLFAHGSSSSRHSRRNRLVAEVLQHRGLATLLFDLLTDAEAQERANVFDIELLASRLLRAMQWSRRHDDLKALPLGLFGASTGAAAALVAAAERPRWVSAIVSRGGRPDLARAALPSVRAPALLIVGAMDREVLALNRDAYRLLAGEKRLDIVPRATHLFEKAGALERVADLAGEWFVAHLMA